MAERVFLSGSSGFVGGEIAHELVRRGSTLSVLEHRRTADLGLPGDDKLRVVRGGLFDDAALGRAMEGCAAAVHLVGIIREYPRRGLTFQRLHVEGTQRVVEAAQRNGVPRFIHMSALGARAEAASEYHRTKFAAEEIVRGSGLRWTIFRPSLIHGPRGDFMRMEARWARKKAPPYLFMPYFGAGLLGRRGGGRLQPVYVGDVARAFVDALHNDRTIGRTYDVVGRQVVTWPQMHRIAAGLIVGRRRWVMPVPAWYARLLTYLLPRFLLPFNRDQVAMALEDNTADLEPFSRDLGFTPGGFEETLGGYAARL